MTKPTASRPLFVPRSRVRGSARPISRLGVRAAVGPGQPCSCGLASSAPASRFGGISPGAQGRSRPTQCNIRSSALGRARDAAFALTNRGVTSNTTRDWRPRHRQKTHEISERLRNLGRVVSVDSSTQDSSRPRRNSMDLSGRITMSLDAECGSVGANALLTGHVGPPMRASTRTGQDGTGRRRRRAGI